MKKNALLFILLSLIPSGLHPAFEFRYYGFRNSAQGEIVSCLDKTLPPASPAAGFETPVSFRAAFMDLYGLGLARVTHISTIFPVSPGIRMGLSLQNLDSTPAVPFPYGENVITLSWSQKILPSLFWGLNLNSGKISMTHSGTFYGLDAGLFFSFRNFHLGLLGQNINTPRLLWDSDLTEELDPVYRAGLSAVITGTRLSLELENENNLHCGIEIPYKNILFSAGAFDRDGQNMTAGIGLTLGKYLLSYGLVSHPSLGTTQLWELEWHFR